MKRIFLAVLLILSLTSCVPTNSEDTFDTKAIESDIISKWWRKSK